MESSLPPTPESAKEVVRRALSASSKKAIADPSLTPAAVMVLLYVKNGEYHVLLNRRTNRVAHHKGEISFPGGSRDDGDETLLHTALRETREEMGILPHDVEVVGEMDDLATTRTRFLITPHVGVIPYPYPLRPSEAEVAEVLEVPLSALMDGGALRDEVHVVDGRLVSALAYSYQGNLIYGATARVLSRLLELIGKALD